MNVLIVCSGNVPNFVFKIHQAFIYEQIEVIKRIYNINYETFFIKGTGLFGYLKNLPLLLKKIKNNKPDIIHAHYGMSALLANLQRKVPVVCTLHGSDLNVKKSRKYSLLARFLSKATIIVSNNMLRDLKKSDRDYIIPCGVNFDTFIPLNKIECRKKLGWDINKIYILFSSHFNNHIKNFKLAQQALSLINVDYEIIELKNKSREEVNILLNAVDFLLLTSFSEGSPQIIKEAMACNCPIVATDVGDIKEIIDNTEGCYITTFDPIDVSEKINKAVEYAKTKGKTNGRIKIKQFDNKIIAKKVYNVYKWVLNENM